MRWMSLQHLDCLGYIVASLSLSSARELEDFGSAPIRKAKTDRPWIHGWGFVGEPLAQGGPHSQILPHFVND